MKGFNIEIKARTKQHEFIREILKYKDAEYKGLDHQIDTYFNTTNGRLKLREGNIEQNLIYYSRLNQKGPKQSDVVYYEPNEIKTLKDILTKSAGILTVVDKQREI